MSERVDKFKIKNLGATTTQILTGIPDITLAEVREIAVNALDPLGQTRQSMGEERFMHEGRDVIDMTVNQILMQADSCSAETAWRLQREMEVESNS